MLKNTHHNAQETIVARAALSDDSDIIVSADSDGLISLWSVGRTGIPEGVTFPRDLAWRIAGAVARAGQQCAVDRRAPGGL